MMAKERILGSGVTPSWVVVDDKLVSMGDLEANYLESGANGYDKAEVDAIAHELSEKRRIIDYKQDPDQDFLIAERVHRHILVLRNAGITLDK